MTNKTLNLKTNCRKCSVILNEETWTLNRSASKGILSECKFCRRKSRKETPSYYDRKKSTYIKYCLRCNNKLLITSKSHNYCSFNCIFESSYSISPTGCWIWNIPLQKHPSMNFMKKRIKASRYSFEIKTGKILDKNSVLIFECNNNLCVNSNHFIETTRQENAAKYRPLAKVTSEIINETKKLFHEKKWTYKDIGKYLKLSPVTIRTIIMTTSSKEEMLSNNLDSDEAMQKLLNEINKALGV